MRTLKTFILSLALVFGLVAGPISAHSGEAAFSQAELDQMLAPVALYPDTVLSHVLIASTYPLEVIQAARWSRANPDLSGEEAVAAVEHKDWDPSVMALVAFPELLARMDEDIEWTQRLGDAFLVQEEEVVYTVQRLREKAYAQGNLKTNEHVRVVRETEYIYIEPRRTRMVYVPYYDPRVVYGPWWWSAHPPVYWHYPRYVSGVTFYWGRAYRVSPRFYFSSFYWPHRQVVVINHHHHYRSGGYFRSSRQVAHHKDRRHWQHNPRHRRGVAYHRNISERRFVEQPSGQTVRAATNRPAQARDNQRDWAAERRENLAIGERSQRSDARLANRADQRTSAQRQARATDSSATPAQRQDRSASATRSRPADSDRSRESSQRAATSPRQASEVRESLANRDQPRPRGEISREAAGRSNRTEATAGRAEAGDSRPSIPRQQREDSRPTVSIPRAQGRDDQSRITSRPASPQRQTRSASEAFRPDAGAVSSRLQATRSSGSTANTSSRSTPSRPNTSSSANRPSQPQAGMPRATTRQSTPPSQPRATPPQATTRQSTRSSSPRSSSSAPQRSPRQSSQPSRSSSAPAARSAPRSTSPRSSSSNTRSAGNRSASSSRSSSQSQVRSRGGNRER